MDFIPLINPPTKVRVTLETFFVLGDYMQIISDISEMQNIAKKIIINNKSHGFIPTMGALHDGHLSLVKESVKENDYTTVSIFVNPMQFAANEDLDKYPSNFKKDRKLLEELGVNYIFLPTNKTMYSEDFYTKVIVSELTKMMCGQSRPEHFAGVTTVCTKLFNITMPNTAYFGQKDFQQCLIIKKMVKDLNIPLEIKMMPIIRENDGLAMSSRNVYLNKDERAEALILSKALNYAKTQIDNGIKDTRVLYNKIHDFINNNSKLAKIDYIEIRNAKNLSEVNEIKDDIVIAIAVFIGTTRLIDNIIISL